MNTLSVAVFAAVCAVASAGLLAQQVAVPAATYSNYGARISQSARPIAYAQAPVYQQAIAAPVYQQAIAAPVAQVAYQQAIPAATYSTFKNRVSQSARPIAVQTIAQAPVAVAHASPIAYGGAIAGPVGYAGGLGGLGYAGGLAGVGYAGGLNGVGAYGYGGQILG
ncbi:unnamed protein product [Orchesella dallaii]|uniref:Cuticle protein n=1 Tax=Orchesella dallaii TaxID=48710 RepID=A0ABP1S5Q8_9HEXA